MKLTGFLKSYIQIVLLGEETKAEGQDQRRGCGCPEVF